MIGFNRLGQTKVWVNENFGMNHPTNQSLEATLNESLVLNNLVAAVSPKLDLAPDFLNGVKNSRTLFDALNFVRANAGVPENVLEANRVNVAGFSQQRTSVLNSNIPVQQVPQNFVPQPQTSVVNPSVGLYQPPNVVQPSNVVQQGYRPPQQVNYGQPQTYGNSAYQQPIYSQQSYQPVNQAKFSSQYAQ